MSTEMNRKMLNDFIEYVYEFYGPNGVYDLGFKVDYILIAKATVIRINCNTGVEFVGDSYDREQVRDIMITMMKSIPIVEESMVIDAVCS